MSKQLTIAEDSIMISLTWCYSNALMTGLLAQFCNIFVADNSVCGSQYLSQNKDRSLEVRQ